jgi:hypothetical protein
VFNVYSEYHTSEALQRFGDFNIDGQILRTAKYADNLELLAKEETVPQGMIDSLTEIGIYYGIEINVEKLT